ncbi:MAG: electron transport complex subunit RsxC [Desulfobulbaceae bacterium]|jgi:electron transport complex protein RnfC|nr:electron transport complex subunit RsxC [Desulfobulbaceae bacterium]
MTTLLTFPKGGVHPPDAKQLTADCPIEVIPTPDELEIILGQHIGAPCTPTVDKRATVTEGEMIGEVKKGLGVPLHAPVAGTIKLMGMSGHPMRVKAPSMTIKVDHDAPANEYTRSDWSDKDGKELLSLVHGAGLVGIGGAGFPTHVKLSPPPSDTIDTLILNGAECEPYITSDYRQMLEMSDEIIEGAKIILKILGIKNCCIGIESNKPEAIKAMSAAAAKGASPAFDIKVIPLQVKYPQGSEKQLIQSITGRKVKGFALPSSVGVVVHNVATTRAIYDAIVLGKPLYEKIVTISGLGINKVGNFRVKVGTKISDIVDYCGGVNSKLSKIIMGGPMMGFNISSLDIPITKTTSAILFLSAEEIDTTPHSNCIRCGWCLEACPMGVEAKEIAIHVEAGKGEDTSQFGVFECFECGCCAYVCPAKRPLVQFMRLAKMKAKR